MLFDGVVDLFVQQVGVMAKAAADPMPAAVMTWARGSMTLPAAQTPAMLVRPVRSVGTQLVRYHRRVSR
ncbi:hypothetical protein [Nonomuraea sp. NPDC049480]|uniref:hypothetical protein n=1 Tax=Nonomuraea sp. NPDC049480 TaxID=3364353 RepID=UPI0037A1D229